MRRQAIKLQVFYPHTPERVWRVITDRRALADWLMDNDFEPRLGHKFWFRGHTLPGLDGAIQCQVIALDMPKRLSYTWQDSLMSQPTVVTWTLTPVAGGTRLQLEHQGCKPEPNSFDELMRLPGRQASRAWYQSPSSNANIRTLEPITSGTQPFSYRKSDTDSSCDFYLEENWNYKLRHRLLTVLNSMAAEQD
ncbi:SRPBCC domain-containing protein [Leptolyngbya sp. FACHB-261]|uniref:SRPBCC family protein n=1 Tax=Leptolyngbya sp. FACHB-261 TaxID=2692806 RepID=UPI001683220C|nr:SRPBCC domain-containing protein [Leptolyngbya sp. FACHB-261]MBD2104519.1 SRPBCC domain-containing protein [Leptolyngbya sp. FACHB-261]